MKFRNLLLSALTACALVGGAMEGRAQADYTVDPGDSWIGFMNVYNLPATTYPTDLGAAQFASGWGTADLVAYFTGSTLTLAPNTIGDPDPYWYIGGGGPGATGNKIMDANMYVELPVDTVNGQLVTFEGIVLSDTLTLANNADNVDANTNGWTSVAFIKDFAPDYSSFNLAAVPLGPGSFSVSLNADIGAGRHVQYGFETIGPNVWITDVGPYGDIQITAIPEPTTFALAGIGAVALLMLRRRD